MNSEVEDASVFSGEQNIVHEILEELAEHRKHWSMERDDSTQAGVPWCRALE